jgi:hypothetical protein
MAHQPFFAILSQLFAGRQIYNFLPMFIGTIEIRDQPSFDVAFARHPHDPTVTVFFLFHNNFFSYRSNAIFNFEILDGLFLRPTDQPTNQESTSADYQQLTLRNHLQPPQPTGPTGLNLAFSNQPPRDSTTICIS